MILVLTIGIEEKSDTIWVPGVSVRDAAHLKRGDLTC